MVPFKRHYIPNALTVFRLVAAPVLVYLFLEDRVVAACLLFTIASFTDLFDGLLARALNAESDVGALLDPLADKSLVLVSYITLAAWGLIPGELVLLVILRDLAIVTAYFSFPTAFAKGRITASPLSKFNTAAQLGLLLVAFWSLALPHLGFALTLNWLVTALVWLVTLTTLVSGIGYGIAWRERYREQHLKGQG